MTRLVAGVGVALALAGCAGHSASAHYQESYHHGLVLAPLFQSSVRTGQITPDAACKGIVLQAQHHPFPNVNDFGAVYDGCMAALK